MHITKFISSVTFQYATMQELLQEEHSLLSMYRNLKKKVRGWTLTIYLKGESENLWFTFNPVVGGE